MIKKLYWSAFFLATLVRTAAVGAEEPVTLENVTAPPPIAADEPLAREFSLALAAKSLDTTALHWQKTRKCAACHTLPPFLLARPLLLSVSPEPPEVRQFFETTVAERREGEPSLPQDALSAVVIETAAALALHDRATTGKLHPRTRQQLDRMWTLQRPDGTWEWPFRDTPPFKSDEHYGVVLAALATGAAPENYAGDKEAQAGLAKIRKYLAAQPVTSPHQQGMLLWAAVFLDDLITPAAKEAALGELLAAQRPDGGWSLASLTTNDRDPLRQTDEGRAARAEKGHGSEFLVYVGRDKVYKSSLASDGYATGFTLYVLRQAGVPAADPRIQKGAAWLKTNQRASGRWFTPSQSWHTQHYIANAGTAFAVMALDACQK